uniref:Uncharacterized protein n=1 Tax=Geospiza parvula TaxID=87175 RepID=A0A8C3NRD2_GEOPR
HPGIVEGVLLMAGGGKNSNYPRKATEQVGHSCRPQKEVDMNYSCSPPGNSAGPAEKQELSCGDKETCDTYCQKQGESPAGEFPPSSTSFHLQREDEDLDHCSSEHSRKPRMITKLREDNGSAALGDVLGEELEPVPEEALPYRCKKCGSSFRGVSELQEHRRAHLLENSYRCPICQHNAECPDQACPANPKSQEDDFKPYACPTCGKGFDKPNLLSKHKVIHREDKPYKCQECGMAFVQLLRLKRHQQTHSGARPFYCEECGGTFTRLASLQRHHRIHTGEKPYSCNFCGHSFTESGTLRRHERTHKLDKP